MMIFKNKYKIDLNAPIIAGKSAAGFTLGINKSDIDKQVLNSFEFVEIYNKYLPDYPPLHEYRTKDVILHLYENKLTQIGLIGNYKGKLDNKLGLGDFVRDFEAVYGDLKEGDEEELVFSNLKGLCFEVDSTKYNSDNWTTEITKLPVIEIYIYKKY